MTLRIAYNLFTQKPKHEKEDFARWIKMTGPGKGDDFFRCTARVKIWSSRRLTSRIFSSLDPTYRLRLKAN